MKRREFITVIGGGVIASPLVVHAQQSGKLQTIGFMGAGTPSVGVNGPPRFYSGCTNSVGAKAGTSRLNIAGRKEVASAMPIIAAEFVRLKVDVIVTVGGNIAKQATSDIPIVFALAGDPIGQGLVASMARPGGNITGMSLQALDLAGKRLEILREFVPTLRKLAVLTFVGNTRSELEVNEVQAAAKSLGLEIVMLEIRQADGSSPAIDTLRDRAEALYVPSNPLANTNRVLINDLALSARMPTVHGFRQYVDTGGLISYGPSTPDLFRRAAEYVDKFCAGRSRAIFRSSNRLPPANRETAEAVLNRGISVDLAARLVQGMRLARRLWRMSTRTGRNTARLFWPRYALTIRVPIFV